MTAHDGRPHDHAWRLADGTGLHAPAGEIVVEEDSGRLCCHLCGHWFRSLGSHVRAHGHTAESYRAELGLSRSQPLTHQGLSAAISARQKRAYRSSDDVRGRLADGQEKARSGELSKRAAAARIENPLSIGAVARQAEGLRAGRETSAARRQAALERVLDEAGSADLPSYLRHRYARGASLAQLAAETGLGRSRLSVEMRAAGIELRAPGENTSDGRRSRARAAELAAAHRVGTDDLAGWLQSRRERGWTLTALGVAVGHSSHWVKWRLLEATDVPAAPESQP